MSNRGNQDYYKIGGTPTELSDIADIAHRHVASDRAAARGARKPPATPQAQAVPVHPRKKAAPRRRHNAERKAEERAAGRRGGASRSAATHVEHVAENDRIEEVSADTETRRDLVAPPSVTEILRGTVVGAWKIGRWAAETTLRYSREAARRRIDRAGGRRLVRNLARRGQGAALRYLLEMLGEPVTSPERRGAPRRSRG